MRKTKDLLNGRLPKVTDELEDGRRVVNHQETLAAQEKGEALQRRFAEWLWSDADRAERLARRYNDTFNAVRPRDYDGSHLSLPGSNPAFTLRPYQVQAAITAASRTASQQAAGPAVLAALNLDRENAQVRASYDALTGRDAERARAVIVGDRSIDRQYRRLCKELKEDLRQHAGELNTWLQLLSTARNLERIADHATDIAQTIVYLQEGIIIRHKKDFPAANP